MVTSKKERIFWIDLYKAIGIVLICSHHVFQNYPKLYWIVRYITIFHVSMFFFIYGLITRLQNKKHNNFVNNFKVKLKRLLIPYLFWALFSALIKMCYLLLANKFSLNILFSEFYDIVTIGNGPVWFLSAMFCVSILFDYLTSSKLRNSSPLICSLIFMFYLSLSFYESSFVLYILIRRTLLGMLEMFIGYFAIKLILHIKKQRLLTGCILIAIEFFLFYSFRNSVGISFKTGASSMPLLSIILCNLMTIGIALLLYGIEFKKLFILKRISFIYGQNSMVILVVHPIILNAIIIILNNINYNFEHSYISCFVLLILLTSCYPFVVFFDKKCGVLVGK